MTMHPRRAQLARWLSIVGGAALLLSCASGTPSRATTSPAEPSAPTPATRTLRVAFQGFEEPKGGVISYGSVGGFDPLEHFMVFHASLIVYNADGQFIPRLADRLPTLENGAWK